MGDDTLPRDYCGYHELMIQAPISFAAHHTHHKVPYVPASSGHPSHQLDSQFSSQLCCSNTLALNKTGVHFTDKTERVNLKELTMHD